MDFVGFVVGYKAPVFRGWNLAIIIQTFFTTTAIFLLRRRDLRSAPYPVPLSIQIYFVGWG